MFNSFKKKKNEIKHEIYLGNEAKQIIASFGR